MISVVRQIKTVDISFEDKKIIHTLPHFNSAHDPFLLQLPIDIKYNEHWKITHECDQDITISFSRAPQHNWNFINRLFTRYYKKELIHILADSFDSLQAFQSEKSEYIHLTPSTFKDKKAPIYSIPQVKFNAYSCEKSGKQFLCRFAEGLPIDADRTYPQGLEGRLMLKEIVEIELDSKSNFTDFVKSYFLYD